MKIYNKTLEKAKELTDKKFKLEKQKEKIKKAISIEIAG